MSFLKQKIHKKLLSVINLFVDWNWESLRGERNNEELAQNEWLQLITCTAIEYTGLSKKKISRGMERG